MSDAEFFSGKLTTHSLPSLTSGSGPGVPALKRLMLPQGELAQIHDSGLPIHYIATIELAEGSTRGNHYHDSKLEHVYVMRGELELLAQDMGSGELAQLVMQSGDLAIIHPGVAHALRVLRGGFAIEFAPTQFDPSDVHRHQLT